MKTTIGIDISKKTLEISNLDKFSSCENNKKDIEKFIKKVNKIDNLLVVFEPTGGYESLLSKSLSKSKIPFAMVSPRQVRSFANSMNVVKTDKIDAKMIADFAAIKKLEPMKPLSEKDIEAKELLTRRRQLIDMRTAESNRLENVSNSIMKEIKEHISYLNKKIEKIDKELESYVEVSDDNKRKAFILQSVKGVGVVLTRTILTLLPEIGTLSSKEIARLVGLAPINCDSGKMSKKRKTIGGRMEVKSVLYMCTMSAIRHNPVFKEFYNRLLKSGKLRMVALVATMRKLMVTLNAMIKNDTEWGLNKKPLLNK